MILIIDNYDSFAYNLQQLVGESLKKEDLDDEVFVLRNDDKRLLNLDETDIEKIIISPGPGSPLKRRDFGFCGKIINELKKNKPILGVCLGHQGIYSFFGGDLCYIKPVHGKVAEVFHDGSQIFDGVPNPLQATRYHSIACNPNKVPQKIKIIGRTADNIIMAIKHKKYPIYGLQFHPESIGTPHGKKILTNFLLF